MKNKLHNFIENILSFYIPFHRLISFAITYIFILQQTGWANRGKY